MQSLHQHCAFNVLVDSNDAMSIERVQYISAAPLVIHVTDDLENYAFFAARAEHDMRTLGFTGRLDNDAPLTDEFVDSLLQRSHSDMAILWPIDSR